MHQSSSRLLIVTITATLLICGSGVAQDEVEGVQSKNVALPDKLEYFLIGSTEKQKTPERGYKLLIVLPGGDGGPDFGPFIQNIYKNSLDEEYLVLQLVAPPWKKESNTWPLMRDTVSGKKVPVETFITRAVDDIKKRTRIDDRHIYTLSWSSGGPAAYAASLTKNTPITGSFVAMSVFHPNRMPSLEAAKGKPYYIFHSQQDQVCPYNIAVKARDSLKDSGAKVEFVEYSGGHGWTEDPFGNIRKGVEWLEKQNEN